jgi:general secretion pathway protein A
MYLQHYGLLRAPFEMTPDPAFLYLGEAHQEGLATLVYGVRARKGFVMLTGEVGTGKTTLLHALLSQLDPNTQAAFVFNPRLEPLDFFRLLFEEYGIETPCATKGEYLIAFNKFLIERLERDHPTLLIVDEAQNLSAEMLEEVRLLSNLETPTSKLIQIMLVGQPELEEKLARQELRQLRQRIVLRFRLRPFTAEETAHYVQERLRLAGYTGKGLFRRGALARLHAVTGGVPRLINVVCDGALLLGYGRGATAIDTTAIEEVASDLGLLERPVPAVASEPRREGAPAGRWTRLRRFFGGKAVAKATPEPATGTALKSKV